MTEEDYAQYHRMGVLFQLNLPSVLGVYGEGAMHRAWDLLGKGWYTMAGSDCHRMRSISGQYASKVLKSAQIKQLESLMKAI
jgi:tyrosine-protein phosphatase YwqE